MRRKPMTTALLCLAAVAILALAAGPAAAGRNVNPRVLPPHATAFGLSYGEWCNRYFQWQALIPTAENPLTDRTGARAGAGQTGKVWFLTNGNDWQDVEGGAYESVERSITVPNGKALFVPLNLVCYNIPSNAPDEAALRALADYCTSHVTALSATIDGRKVRDPFAYRTQSPLFDLWWIEDNVVGLGNDPEGDPALWADNPTPTIADGYCLILAPLSVGHHEIRWHNESLWTAAEDGFDFAGTEDVIYHITVVPR